MPLDPPASKEPPAALPARVPTEPATVTGLLARWLDGDPQAAHRLMPRVYGELRRLARGQLRGERCDHTLGPTALVHELYARLLADGPVRWRDRRHFFALSVCMMRRLLVEHGRRRARAKRGGGLTRLPAEALDTLHLPRPEHLLALDRALDSLAAADPRKARIVELRFFAGLSIEDTAHCLGISTKTVNRDWRRARAWLYDELVEGHDGP